MQLPSLIVYCVILKCDTAEAPARTAPAACIYTRSSIKHIYRNASKHKRVRYMDSTQHTHTHRQVDTHIHIHVHIHTHYACRRRHYCQHMMIMIITIITPPSPPPPPSPSPSHRHHGQHHYYHQQEHHHHQNHNRGHHHHRRHHRRHHCRHGHCRAVFCPSVSRSVPNPTTPAPQHTRILQFPAARHLHAAHVSPAKESESRSFSTPYLQEQTTK